MSGLWLLALAACVEADPPPEVGACASYPEGVYEYGEIGIGTCLAGPADLAFVGDRLLVSNANPWANFSGGSVLSLDLAALPLDGAKHLVDELDPVAVPLPSFNGPMALAEDDSLLLVTNKYSEGSRTRESVDDLWFLDVSDPADPVLAEGRGSDGAALPVGADPTAVSYDPDNGVAYVVNRTDHSVALVDTTVAPAELLPPGGPARVLPGPFTDVDASGSRASFALLENLDTTSLFGTTWTARWSPGAVRLWVPGERGAWRVEGDGEDGWRRSELDLDLDVEVSDGLVNAIADPWFLAYDDGKGNTVGRMFFMDGGAVHGALVGRAMTDWAFEKETLFTPDPDAWDAHIGGPAGLLVDLGWYLFYDGGDGQTQSIGLAISPDGVNYTRADAPILTGDGVSFEDPFVVFDSQAASWRMWFTVIDGTSWSIGEARSDDLFTWVDTGNRFEPPGGAGAPAVQYYGGQFHLFYDTPGLRDGIYEAVSRDGTHWTARGLVVPIGPALGREPRRVAAFALNEGLFTFSDATGRTTPAGIVPGDTFSNTSAGFSVRLTAGQWLDPEDVPGIGDAGVVLDAVVGTRAYLSLLAADGTGSVAMGTVSGRTITVSDIPAIAPGDAGGWDSLRVSDAVVIEVDGLHRMYFAGTDGGASAIGIAESGDGLSWVVSPDPVLEPAEDWESAGIRPGSVSVGADGLFHLYYSAFDGADWRIAEASSADGRSFTRVEGVSDAWIFEGGALGEWDDAGVRDPHVVPNDAEGVDEMWFSGSSGDTWQIGFATRAPGEDWIEAVDVSGAPRPIVTSGSGSIGSEGLFRPVVMPEGDGRVLWYAGLDEGATRVGRAVLGESDRAWRDLNYPTLADTWSFSVIPENTEPAILMEWLESGQEYQAQGCGFTARDDVRGLLYIGCELAPLILALDVRDDSTPEFPDLNYLNLETAASIESTTYATSGARGLLFDPVHDWLWFLNDSPESMMALDLGRIVDDADFETTFSAVVAMLPLPRALEADQGVGTQTLIGPGQLALHPDGRHVFVTNFNANSVSVYDLARGAPGTLIGEVSAVGENPYAIRITPDGRFAVVANYTGEVEQDQVSSTLVVIDADAASPTFLEPLAWIANQ